MKQSKGFYPEKTKESRAKYMSVNLAYNLMENNPDSMLKKSYQGTVHCLETRLERGTANGVKLTSTYCKNRWCAVCNRIRTAVLINGYEPVIKQMEEPYFVTLTKQTVSAFNLPKSIIFMQNSWRKILNDREGRKRKIQGVRKAECTIRPNNHYHYHYHVVIDGKENAKWLVSEWLKQMGSLADSKAQDIRPADQNSLKELFKYFTKLTTKTGGLIDYKRMDVIFRALRGKRVYQPFGGVSPVEEEIDEISEEELKVLSDQLQHYERIWNWSDELTDWVTVDGEGGVVGRLTGYQPNEKFKGLFDSKDIA